jgi:hypothetical protein
MAAISRREWILAAACWTEVLRGQDLASFDRETANEIEAITDAIIPSDGTPGAREAQVIRFIDAALAGYDKDNRDLYRTGLAAAQSARASLFPESKSIAGLSPQQRTKLLQSIEQTEFFQRVRLHTILGYFGNPRYGFKLLGMENSMHFHPPFGYYDREAAQ